MCGIEDLVVLGGCWSWKVKILFLFCYENELFYFFVFNSFVLKILSQECFCLDVDKKFQGFIVLYLLLDFFMQLGVE